MLTLERKQGERILIDPEGACIVVTYCKLRNGKARIGIEAAAEVPIYREEVWKAIQEGRGNR
jgi:carbon storage regulator CsrA